MRIENEKGFILPSLVIIFLVTLALMATGAYVLMRSEGDISADTMIAKQIEYSLKGASDYALNLMKIDDLEIQDVDVGGVSATVDTIKLNPSNGFNPDFDLDITATVGSVSRELFVTIDAFDPDVAIWALGAVDLTVIPRNQSGLLPNWDRMGENVYALPQIDVTTLLALPGAQVLAGGAYSGTRPTGATSFFQSGTTPWVTRYTGDVTLSAGAVQWGIMIVDGDLTISSLANVNGIVYLPNAGSQVTMGISLNATVNGCIICAGDVTGATFVDHNSTYLATLENYRLNPGTADGSNIVAWDYQ